MANYAAAYFDKDLQRWNNVLPEIYTPGQPTASIGIGIHFAAGGIILLLGGLQLIASIRSNYPKVHHWTGRFYVFVSMLAMARVVTISSREGKGRRLRQIYRAVTGLAHGRGYPVLGPLFRRFLSQAWLSNGQTYA